MGQIPQIEANFTVLGNIGRIQPDSPKIVNDFNFLNTGLSNLTLKVATPGSMDINIDDFSTNRLLSYEVSIESQRNPLYPLGAKYPNYVDINWPIQITCNFQAEVDDYNWSRLNDYPYTQKIKNLTLNIRDFTTNQIFLHYSYENLTLISESYGLNVDGNLTLNASYKTYFPR